MNIMNIDKFAIKTKSEPVNVYIRSVNVATCDECNGRGLKKLCKVRVKIAGEPTFCKDCGHALYWERIQRKA